MTAEYLRTNNLSCLNELSTAFPPGYLESLGWKRGTRPLSFTVVDENEEKFFLKCFSPDKEDMAEREVRMTRLGGEALSQLEEVYVPQVLTYMPQPFPHIIYECIEGETIGDRYHVTSRMAQYVTPLVERTIAELQKRTSLLDHDVRVKNGIKLESRLLFLEKTRQLVKPETHAFLTKALGEYYELEEDKLRAVHSDLNMAHLLVSKKDQRLVIIDWEYLAVGEPLKDYAYYFAGYLCEKDAQEKILARFATPRELAVLYSYIILGLNYLVDKPEHFRAYALAVERLNKLIAKTYA